MRERDRRSKLAMSEIFVVDDDPSVGMALSVILRGREL
jgi:hypothetical protein